MLRCPTCRALFAENLSHCPDDGSELEESSDSRLGMTVAGDITLQDVAGDGAMGAVFVGWQAAMERRVAVKMLHRDLSRDEVFVERFMREARAVARLNHPNIVTVHAVGEAADSYFIVMELIDGETLADHIKRGRISELRVIRIARQVTSALADAHAAGIIHRDLKPANILLSQRRRAADFVKILDFGVAKIVDADAQLTRDGFVFGTPAYLSPEQANGVDLDGRSDLYSLGVMMFEMLTGALPFEGSQVQLLLAHAKDPAPRVSELKPDVDPRLDDLVARLLFKDPDIRPRSAEALADELDDLVGGDHESPWASRALWASGDVAVADTVVAGAAASWRGLSTAEQTVQSAPVSTLDPGAAPTQRVRESSRTWAKVLLMLFAGVALLGAGASAVAFGPLREQLPVWSVAISVGTPEEPAPVPAEAQIDQKLVRFDVSRVGLMFSQDGFSLRVLHPEHMAVSFYYQLNIDVWGPSGEPVDFASIKTVIRGPGSEKEIAALVTPTRGSYSMQQAFSAAGEYILEIELPEAESPVEVYLRVHPEER